MFYEAWGPTNRLRFKAGVLQQHWFRKVITYREYGGNLCRCENYEYEWRDVDTAPTDADVQAHGVPHSTANRCDDKWCHICYPENMV